MTKKPNPAQLEFPFMETKTTITSRPQDAAEIEFDHLCTCVGSEYRDDRHTLECLCAPEIPNHWLWYPHDGELENGGVYVDPADRSKIYLFVKGYLVPAFLEES